MKHLKNTINAKHTLIGLAILLIICLCFLGLRKPEARPEPVKVSIAEKAPSTEWQPRIAWPDGVRQVYRLTHRNNEEVRPIVDDGPASASGELMSSQLSLTATVAVTGAGIAPSGNAQRVTFEVLSCEDASWEIAGGVVWSDAAACEAMLVGSLLGADVKMNGVTTAIYDAPDSNTTSQSILQSLWLRLQATLPDAPVRMGQSYDAQDKGLHGTADNEYTLRSEDEKQFVLERTTHAYMDVRNAAGLQRPPVVKAMGNATFTIGKEERLRHVQGVEKLAASTAAGVSILTSETSFSLEWLREEKASRGVDFSQLMARAPTSARVGPNVRAKLLDNRIAGLDMQTLLSILQKPHAGPNPSDQARFLWRATGLLEKSPEESWQLLRLYPDASPEVRARIIDLLASVGHETAQAVMREALGDPDALGKGDVAMHHLYQRLGLLEEPTPETAQMVAEHYRRFRSTGELDSEITTAYTLGAIVAGLSQEDDDQRALADAYNNELADGVRRASNPRELAHRVTALGNTRRTDNLGLLSDVARHESPQVRQRVARAVAKAGFSEPPDVLLDLLSDEEPAVQRDAIRGAWPNESVYYELASEISSNGVTSLNVRPILDLVKHGRQTHRVSTTELLDVLIDHGIRDDKDRELAYMLRSM